MNKKQGITLIALIITIIILLILVGVSVNLAIKGDLFGSAEKAIKGTNAKVEEQQSAVDELMKELENVQKPGETEQPGGEEEETLIHNWKYTDSSRAQIRCTCVKCKAFNDGDSTGRTLSIGQQIGETEIITASTSVKNEECGGGDQAIELTGEETKWVVFGFVDSDDDGINETLLVTTENPTSASFYVMRCRTIQQSCRSIE